MDPLSIAAGSVSIAGGVAKASFAIVEFLNHFKDAAQDLNAVNQELHAITAVLNPLARSYAEAPSDTVPADLAEQVQLSLEGCDRLVGQVASTVEKYQQDRAWTKTKWVLFGRADMDKLRSGLEAYKMALSLGLHAVSITIGESIKQDTGAIRKDTRALRQRTSAIEINTQEILARVTSIQNSAGLVTGDRIRNWVSSMSVLTSYAESAYQEATLGPRSHGSIRSSAVSHMETIYSEGVASDTNSASLSSKKDSVATEQEIGPPSPRTRPQGEPKHAGPQLVPSLRTTFTDATSTTTSKIRDALDLVVAIDLGSTSAAVAWSTEESSVVFIKDWPGGGGQRVPITVAYDEDNNISSWGFQSFDDLDLGKTQYLCAERMDLNQSPSHHAWLEDYLEQLYAYVKGHISSALNLVSHDWEKMGIEFHFTLSDLFRSSSVSPSSADSDMAGFKGLVRRSSFGTSGPRHCVVLGMTETEAAVVGIIAHRAQHSQGPISAFLNIGATHATIVKVEEFGEDSKTRSQFVTESVAIPGLKTHIEATTLAMLKRRSLRVSKELGEEGVGQVIWDSGFRDIMGLLDGSAQPQNSYRLLFEKIPRSVRHGGFLKDGTIELSREQVELILDPLVDQILQRVMESLDRILSAAERKLQIITTLKTADTQVYLLERVGKSIGELPNPTPQGQPDSNGDAAANSGPGPKLHAVPAPVQQAGHRDLTALRGVFARRGAWDAEPGPWIDLQYRQTDNHLRIHVDGSRSGPLVRYSKGDDVMRTSPLCPFTPVERRLEVVNRVIKPGASTTLCLDIYVTRKTGVRYKKLGAGEERHLTSLCTVSWTLAPEDFLGRPWGKRWYGLMASGTIWCDFRLDMLQRRGAGPRFELRVAPAHPARLDLPEAERPSARQPDRVEWHCEPPYMVWPANRAW